MCSARVLLISSTIAASVVDLPEPVGPVTRTRPRGFSASVWSTGGRPSSSSVWISPGTRRKAAPTEPRWKKTLTRKRATPGKRIGEVELPVELELLLLLGREDPVERLARRLGVERLGAVRRREAPADAEGRRRPDREMEVGGVELEHLLEQARRWRRLRHRLAGIGRDPRRP